MLKSVMVRVYMVFISLVVAAGLPASSFAAPAEPTGLKGTVMSPTTMKLDWMDNSLDETAFRIERSDGAAFVSLATVASNVTTYSDTTVVGDILYSYRVFAVSTNGDSNPSNIFSGYTVDTLAPPAPILKLPANGDQLESHTVHFEWNAVKDISGVTFTIVVNDITNGIVLHEVSGITQTSIDLLLYDANYEWNVTATDGAGNVGPTSVNWYFLVLAVDELPPDTVVTAPNGGEVLEGGSIFAITWYALDQWTTPTPDLKVELLFSRDNGDNWDQIAQLNDNPGAFAWRVPNINCDVACLIRVVTRNEVGLYGSDDSDFAFSIVPSPQDSITVLDPNDGLFMNSGSKYMITWDSAVQGGDVSIKLYKRDVVKRIIARRTPNDGSFKWKVPMSLKGKRFKIRITKLDTTDVVADDSDDFFVIK